MESRKILLVGGGGHCISVLDTLINLNIYDEIGIIERDAAYMPGTVMGIPIVGTDSDLQELFRLGWKNAFITLGSIGNTSARRRIYNLLCDIGFHIPTIIDSTSVVSPYAVLENGIFVGKRVVINAEVHIGACAIINTGAIIEHNCAIGSFSHISPGCLLCGEVRVGDDSHIGAASVVRQQIEIGSNTLVGAGSVVVKNLPHGVKAYGNPARVVKER